MPSFWIKLPVVPTAKKTHKSRIAGKGKKQWIQSYVDPKQRTQEDNLREILYREMATIDAVFPIETWVELVILVGMLIPKSASKKKRADMLAQRIRHVNLPDCSNMLKNFEDICKGVLFIDDRQICRVEVHKFYSEHPGWEVKVTW